MAVEIDQYVDLQLPDQGGGFAASHAADIAEPVAGLDDAIIFAASICPSS